MTAPQEIEKKETLLSQLNWTNVVFLTLTPLIALIGTPIYLKQNGLSWPIAGLFVFYLIATGMSITAGYHRLFSHRSYEPNGFIKFLLLFFGAGACQNSALKWSSEHRFHHRYVDGVGDPYNIKKGFFYAHIGWVLMKDTNLSFENARDLQKDPMIRWQHRNYWLLATLVGFVMPFLFGFFVGAPWGMLLIAGLLRIALVHHSTFLINSLSHYIGTQPYSIKDSSRDNILTAFLTFGEGYHNFHHKFQFDYRNGIRWYHWDPTKWTIKFLETIHFVKKLRKVSDETIFQAKIEAEREKLQLKVARVCRKLPEGLEQKLNLAQEKLLSAQLKWNQIREEYRRVKHSIDNRRIEILNALRAELEQAKRQFKEAYESWKDLIREFYRVYANPRLTPSA
ncbi:MAG TPA: fatty acid desaturase [Nitrospiria bacterium]|nr:fatty acid desaturase [Nitrospiria bacterium]